MKLSTYLLLGSLGLSLSLTCALADDSEVDLRLLSGSGWNFSPGAEFPGAKGSFKTDVLEGDEVGILEYDFSAGGGYVQGTASVSIGDEYNEIRFRAKSDQEFTMEVRLGDSSGQTFQYTMDKYADIGEWKTYRLDFRKAASQHFQGANDGVIHFPITSLGILVKNVGDQVGQATFTEIKILK